VGSGGAEGDGDGAPGEDRAPSKACSDKDSGAEGPLLNDGYAIVMSSEANGVAPDDDGVNSGGADGSAAGGAVVELSCWAILRRIRERCSGGILLSSSILSSPGMLSINSLRRSSGRATKEATFSAVVTPSRAANMPAAWLVGTAKLG